MSDRVIRTQPATDIGEYGIRWTVDNETDGKVYVVGFAVVAAICGHGDGRLIASVSLGIQFMQPSHFTWPWTVGRAVSMSSLTDSIPGPYWMHSCGLADLEGLTAAIKAAWRVAIELMGDTADETSRQEAAGG